MLRNIEKYGEKDQECCQKCCQELLANTDPDYHHFLLPQCFVDLLVVYRTLEQEVSH